MGVRKHAMVDVPTRDVADAFRGTWVYSALEPYVSYPMPFAWSALPVATRLAILATVNDRVSDRALRRVLLDTAKAAIDRHQDGMNATVTYNGVKAASYLKTKVAEAARGDAVSLPLFVDMDTSAEAALTGCVQDMVLWANATKSAEYGQEAVRLLRDLIGRDPAITALVDDAVTKNASWSHVGQAVARFATSSAPSNEMLPVESSLAEFLPEDVIQVLTSVSGGLAEGWLSLSDAQAACVALSRPVVESDASYALETLVYALQMSAVAFDVASATVEQKAIVSILTTASVNTIVSVGPTFVDTVLETVAHTPQVTPAVADLGMIAQALRDVLMAQMPTARLALYTTMVSLFDGLTSEYKETAKNRFLRTLRDGYDGDDIVHAFMPHNVAVNTHALDVEKVKRFLSKRTLGGLASTYLTTRDIDQAWKTMPVRSYLEMLRWSPFETFASGLPNEPVKKLRPMAIRLLAKMHKRDLDEVLVAGLGCTSSALIEQLLVSPIAQELRLSDYMTSNGDLREFIHRLVTLANLTRRTDKLDDEGLHLFSTVLNSTRYVGQEQLDALRRLCAALLPDDQCVAFIKAEIAASL